MNLRLLLRLQFILLFSTATALSLMPVTGTPIANLWDKPLHLTGWCGLYLSLQLAFKFRAAWLVAAPSLLVYSLLIECVQSQVGRSFSLLDLFANACGIALACLAIVIAKKLLSMRKTA